MEMAKNIKTRTVKEIVNKIKELQSHLTTKDLSDYIRIETLRWVIYK